MVGADERARIRQVLYDRVGAFFWNTNYVKGFTCRVCRGPAELELCARCRGHRTEYGSDLADLVLTLTYVKGEKGARNRHQSATTMRRYKSEPSSRRAVENLSLMVHAASLLHQGCIAELLGKPWSAVSFVPSTKRVGADQPVAGLARQVAGVPDAGKFLLDLGPSAQEEHRVVLPDRFAVRREHVDRVRGQNVVIVDDTWTTGAKAQSAALAVRAAGAAHVTLLCVARWCRYDWDDHRALLDRLTRPYDAACCPLSGIDESACP